MEPWLSQIIDNPRYRASALRETIHNLPTMYNMLGRMGLFSQKGIDTTYVEIERMSGQLNILPVTERGGPSTRARSNTRDKIIVPTYYMSHGDALKASDLQNLPMFGAQDFFERFDEKLFEKLALIKRKYAQTMEFWRWNALNGSVVDADGETELYNVYTLMGETQPDFDLKLGTTTDDGVLDLGYEIRRYMETNAQGEPIGDIVVFCHSVLFDKIRKHPIIREIYKHQAMDRVRPNPNVDDVFMGFRHGNTVFVEHNGRATYVDPNTGAETVHDFLTSGEGLAVPLGTMDVFKEYFAPGERMDAVNQPGRQIYVDMKEMDWGRGIEIETESAPLTLVKKPRLVGRVYTSN